MEHYQKNIKKHFGILGMEVIDKVTKYKGIATSLSFDLYGCINVLINKGLDDKGEPASQNWFDIGRLEVKSKKPMMQPPNYEYGIISEGKQGCEIKPLIHSA